MSDDIDLETGQGTRPKSTRDNHPTSNPTAQKSAAERLKLFRDLVGIHPLPMAEDGFTRPAPNVGTYKRLIEALAKRRIQYYTSASFINACLFGQIVVAAALTSLGAAAGSHVLITILGSINTVIAGIMTYLKGQGLPDRLLEDANGLRRVREYLEQIERQLVAGDPDVDVEEEAGIIYDMYNQVRKNAEDNVPSNWKSLDTTQAKEDAQKLERKKKAQTKYRSIGNSSPPPDPMVDQLIPAGREGASSSAQK
jgi:hypothetical protein